MTLLPAPAGPCAEPEVNITVTGSGRFAHYAERP